jgi:hypothetical protein
MVPMTDAPLANCRLMVATPIYEGAQGTYVRAALDLALRAQAIGLPVRFEFILYQPSITRARNTLAAMFLGSDCTHILDDPRDGRQARMRGARRGLSQADR